MKKGSCPKCGSADLIENGRIDISSGGYSQAYDFTVTVQKHPDAVLFKGVVSSKLRAWVCGACGFTELYVNNPQKLLEAFRQQAATP
jgi:predicted nucleic-acid-binding Zn-ribbon protein